MQDRLRRQDEKSLYIHEKSIRFFTKLKVASYPADEVDLAYPVKILN
jgi:hypothetical protein